MKISRKRLGLWEAAIVLAALAIGGVGLPARAAADAAPIAARARGPPIRLDAEQQQAMGLTYGVVERRSIDKTIRTVGRFDFDERKLAAVTLKVSGYIKDLFVDYTGKPVRKGEPLFTIYSPELVSARAGIPARRAQPEGAREEPGAERGAVGRFAASRQPRAFAALGSERAAGPRARGSGQAEPPADDLLAGVGHRAREDGRGRPERAGRDDALQDRRSVDDLGLRRHLRVRAAVREGRPDGERSVFRTRPTDPSRRASRTSIRRSTRRPAP